MARQGQRVMFGSRPGGGSRGFRLSRKCRYQTAHDGAAVAQCGSVLRGALMTRGGSWECVLWGGGVAPVWTYWVMTASWWFEQACVMDVPLFSVAPGVSRARKSSAQATGDLAFVMNNP